MAEIFGKLQPFISTLVDLYVAAYPYCAAAAEYVDVGYQRAKPYIDRYWKPEYLQLLGGVVLLFFGGTFAMTIACFMAVRLSGWATIKKSWSILRRNYREGMESFEQDPAAKKFFDRDGDGRISGAEIGSAGKMLFSGSADQKKMVLMNLRCVFVAIDPNEVMSGIGGLWQTAIAVVATLRSKFAKDVALGASIGSMLSNQVGVYLKPLVQKGVADDLKQWADFLVDGGCRFVGISLALIMVRVVGAFHSAVLGGQLMARFALQFLANKQNIPIAGDSQSIHLEGTTLFVGIQYGMAALGFYWQLTQGFGINSIWLRMLLLPFSVCEWVLTILAVY